MEIKIKGTTHVCKWCGEGADEQRGLVSVEGSYEHPTCSTEEYQFVTAVSVPSGDYCKCGKELDPLVEGHTCIDCLLDQAADLADFRDNARW